MTTILETLSEPKKCILCGWWLCQNRSFSSLWILDFIQNFSKTKRLRSAWVSSSEIRKSLAIWNRRGAKAEGWFWEHCQPNMQFVCPVPLTSSHFWVPAQSPSLKLCRCFTSLTSFGNELLGSTIYVWRTTLFSLFGPLTESLWLLT